MNILHVVGGLDRGGAETMLVNLLSNKNAKYSWYFLCFGNEREFAYTKIIEDNGGVILFIENPTLTNYHIFKEQLSQVLDEYRIDVVHSHILLKSGFISKSVKQINSSVKVIVHSHSSSDNSSSNWKFLRKIYEYISKKMISRYSDTKLYCSTEAGIYLFGNLSGSNNFLFNNTIDVEHFQKIFYEDGSTDKNIPFKKEKDVLDIVMVGRLEPVKNHYLALEIASKLKKNNNILFKMHFFGVGSLELALKEKVINMGLEDTVFFHGLHQDTRYVYKFSDLLIMPSLFEGFPMTLLESQAMSLFSIVSKNVDSEVDIGVSMIDFIDIEDVNSWVKTIESFSPLNLESRMKNLAYIAATMNKKMYNSKTSVKYLENKFYEGEIVDDDK